jgi:peptidoglycan/xylan/chitin deacetylase (PgdA/CDA1 family)
MSRFRLFSAHDLHAGDMHRPRDAAATDSTGSGELQRRTVLAAMAALGTAAAGGCDSPTSPSATSSQGGPAGPAAASSGSPVPQPSTPAANARPSTSGLPAEIVHGPRDVPAVALTFHGQGEPALVRKLLDALAAADTRVTVLAVGVWLQQQPDLAKRILDGGHELGNHTQHHGNIAAMPQAQAFAEIDDCATALRRLTGSIGRWFRPSQTQYSTPGIQSQAARVGYPVCLSYDVDSLDYTDPGAAAVVRNTLKAAQNGSIVSLHFGHPDTVAALPDLLAGLHTRGLRAVTMTELLG